LNEHGAGAAPGARLRVLFVNRYYSPDLSATSQMLTDLAEALARSGVEVGVICSRQLYENAGADLPASEVIHGVSVRRVAGSRFGRDRLVGRAIDYLSFYIGATRTLLRLARDFDVLVMKTDPPLLSLVGWLVAAQRRIPCVNWLHDVFPEVASRLALAPWPRPLEAPLCALRDRSLAAAEANVVLGSRMRDYLVGRGIASTRLSIAENWADETALAPRPASQSTLRRRLSLLGRFVVAYSGNLGRAHDAETLLAAAEELRRDPDMTFLLIGGGIKMRALETQARERGLAQLRFLPYQPRESLGDSLAAGDVHLITLLPQLEGLIVPSKFYGILAAGRPVVFVGDRDGELAQVIRDGGVGVTVACGDSPGLCRALRALRDAPLERERMGERARLLFEQRYTLRASVARWHEVLTRAASRGRDGTPAAGLGRGGHDG
jgi:glycosyltransferase involved in cell wall biosynthesis